MDSFFGFSGEEGGVNKLPQLGLQKMIDWRKIVDRSHVRESIVKMTFLQKLLTLKVKERTEHQITCSDAKFLFWQQLFSINKVQRRRFFYWVQVKVQCNGRRWKSSSLVAQFAEPITFTAFSNKLPQLRLSAREIFIPEQINDSTVEINAIRRHYFYQ